MSVIDLLTLSPHYVYRRSMKLDDYLRLHGLSSARFAEDCGILSKQTVHNYRHGARFPTPLNLRRISDATKGAVTADDFVAQHVGPATRSSARRRRAPAREPVVDEAIAVVGGPESFARVCGVTVTEVRSWRSVPSSLVSAIAEATGIAPTRLRPDLYPPETTDADRMVA